MRGWSFLWFVLPHVAIAASKEECLEAHGRGQDLRAQGQLRAAKQTFLACAQSSCPPLVQADCARFGEEIDRVLPTVSFGARDARGADLPNTTVWVDGAVVSSRLDDGRSYELEPGAHALRFVHDGKQTSLDVVLAQGEKGRFIAVTFKDDAARSTPAKGAREEGGSALPLVVAGVGLASAAVGGVLVGVGLKSVPAACSFGSRQCAAPAGDPSFDQASSAVNLANAGVAMIVAGGVTLIGGVVWYLLQPRARRVEAALLRF